MQPEKCKTIARSWFVPRESKKSGNPAILPLAANQRIYSGRSYRSRQTSESVPIGDENHRRIPVAPAVFPGRVYGDDRITVRVEPPRVPANARRAQGTDIASSPTKIDHRQQADMADSGGQPQDRQVARSDGAAIDLAACDEVIQ
jgi:hypothetical protein